MEQVIILTQAEYKALNDNIDELRERASLASNSGSKYYAGRGVQVSADEYINGLLKQIAELEEELGDKNEKLALYQDVIDGISYELNRV